MKEYIVEGMSCAACQARVEKAVNAVDGVSSCTVSLLTASMSVEGSASMEQIVKAVEDAGYKASLKDENTSDKEIYEIADKETAKLKKRLIFSLIFLLPLVYISMGHNMFGWPLFAFLAENHLLMGIAEMLLSLVIIIINKNFFISGFKGIIHKAANMDTLVSLGAGTAFIWSCYLLIAMIRAHANADSSLMEEYMMKLNFESAGMILTLITVGKTLESISKGKTTNALRSLMDLSPKTARKEIDGIEKIVPVEEIAVGDIYIVKSGDSIPVDGYIISGSASVDESALTGESIPVDKLEGDNVSAATINKSGYMRCKASRVGKDTTISQIIQMVSDAAATKAPIARNADKVSGIFVPIVISIAIITLAVWLFTGHELSYALSRAISVLVISCPCALGLATPVAIMVGNGLAAKNGILFKNSQALEETGKIQIIALDKTGTITNGTPLVTDLLAAKGTESKDLLRYAYALEKKSEHPLSKAIIDFCELQGTGIKIMETDKFESLPGLGLNASSSEGTIYGGNLKYIQSIAKIPFESLKDIDNISNEGKTPLLFALDDKFLGLIAVADTIKEDSQKAIIEFKNLGIRTVMLTGDNETTANAISKKAGIDNVFASLMPADKEKVINELSKIGKVAMVGDGINDAPALTRADIGIAIGAGADVAIDAADLVVVNSSLTDVSAAVRIARKVLTNIHENLFWAFFYNAIGIPLAAGCFIPIFGWELSPMFGAAAMSLSSFCVVSNALRLNRIKAKNSGKDKPAKNSLKSFDIKDIEEEFRKGENLTMKKTIKIQGMMCAHCEARVKSALESLNGVISADVSHERANAIVELNEDIQNDILSKAVVDAGYEVEGID